MFNAENISGRGQRALGPAAPATLDMIYHLHHQGRNLGVFPLEELRRRRQSGEFSGAEYVWLEGMAEWQPLDSVLNAAGFSSPPPLPSGVRPREAQPLLIAAVIAAGLLVLVGMTVAGLQLSKGIRRARSSQPVNRRPEGLEVTTKKVEWKSNTVTMAEMRKRGADFRKRQWLDGYQSNADRNSPCNAEAVRLIAAWIDSNYDNAGTNLPNIASAYDKLAATPDCQDPLLLTVAALNSTEMHEKQRRIERALAGFPKSRHKAYARLNAIVGLIDVTFDNDRLRDLYDSAAQAFHDCFNDGSFRPEDEAEIAEIVINGWGRTFFRHSFSKVRAIPRTTGKDFEWLSLVLEGEYHVIEAWEARGSGAADGVTEKGWQGFRTHLAAAEKSYTRAWQLRPDLPLAPCRMISVAMGNSGPEQMRLWFDRAIAAQIDYPRAWSDMRWGLHPRWHGSLEAMLALGKTAVRTARFDTDVPQQFFEIVSDIESDMGLPRGQHLYGRPEIWPELSRMYEGYIAAPSQLNLRPGWRSTFAAAAYLAGNYDVARTQLQAVGWKPWPDNLSGWGAELSLMPLEVAARTGPAKADVRAAESFYRSGNVAEALRLYEKLLQGSHGDEMTTRFARHRVAALEVEKRLAAGESIEFLPTGTNDPAWEISFGNIRRMPDGSLEVRADKRGHMLFHRARIGRNFEVTGEFEVVKSSTDDFQAGLVMGLPQFLAPDWRGLRLKRNAHEGQLASFSRGWGPALMGTPVTLKATNSFAFQFRSEFPILRLNGQLVPMSALQGESRREWPADFFVGLGAFNDMNETVIRYRQLKLRKMEPLKSKPAKSFP